MSDQFVTSGTDGAGGDLRLGALVHLEEKGDATRWGALRREEPSLMAALLLRPLAHHALHLDIDSEFFVDKGGGISELSVSLSLLCSVLTVWGVDVWHVA